MDDVVQSSDNIDLADMEDADLIAFSGDDSSENASEPEAGSPEDETVEEEGADWSEDQSSDQDWEEAATDEEGRTEVLVETAIAIGAAGLNIFGQLAGAAWRLAADTGPGRLVNDVASGVRNAALKEGEPYIESAGRWSQEQLARLVAAVTPAVMETIDVTDLAERLDLDALLARIDTDALLEGIDLERIVERVNVRALLESIDMDSLVLKVDLNPVPKEPEAGS